MNAKLGIIIVVCACFINVASATDYYVSTNGDNNDDGLSPSSPYLTIRHSVKHLDPGDTLFLMDGTFNERINIPKSGTIGNPITITGYGSNAVMDGENNKGNAIRISDKEYININNFEITHYEHGIYSMRSDYINVDNMHLHYFRWSALTFYEGHDLTLTNSNLHDAAHNMLQIMGKFNDMWNVLIDSNEIHGNPGITQWGVAHAGIDIFNANYKNPEIGHVSDVTITNNKIYDMHLSGVFTHGDDGYYMNNMCLECNEIYDTREVETGHFKNGTIKNNYVHHQNTWGFYTYVDSGALAMKNMDITGNVVHDCPYLGSNRALGDVTWIDNSIPDFLHWRGTLEIVDNRRKTFQIKAKGTVIVEYTDSREFSVDGETKVGSCKLSPGDSYKVYSVVNPDGSDSVTVPGCISNPSPAPVRTPRPAPTPDDPTLKIPKESEWIDQGTILGTGDTGSWDVRLDGMLSPCFMLKKDDIYFLYYIGSDGDREYPHTDNGPRHRKLGVATSKDGLNYTKYSGNPILSFSPTNNDEEGVFSAGGYVDTNGDVIIYYGAMAAENSESTLVDGDIRLAISKNGFDFEDIQSVVNPKDDAVWGFGDELFPLSCIYINNRWNVYYTVINPEIRWGLGLASGTTKDDLFDTKQVMVSSDMIKGCDPVRINNNKIAAFVSYEPNHDVPGHMEACTAKINNLGLLSEPVEIYHFDILHPKIMYDVDSNVWFMCYYNYIDNSICLKTAYGNIVSSDPEPIETETLIPTPGPVGTPITDRYDIVEKVSTFLFKLIGVESPEIWDGSFDSLKIYKLTPDKNISKTANMEAWIDIVGYNKLVKIDNVFYCVGDPLNSTVVEYKTTEYLSGSKSRWNDNVDWISEDIIYTIDNGSVTVTLNVTMLWHHSTKRKGGKGVKKTYHYDYLSVSDTELLPFEYIESLDKITVHLKVCNNSFSPKTLIVIPDSDRIKTVVQYGPESITYHNNVGLIEFNTKGYPYINLTGESYSFVDENMYLKRIGPYYSISQTNFSESELSITVYGLISNYTIENYTCFEETYEPSEVFHSSLFLIGGVLLILIMGFYSIWRMYL